jgi:hypothetical protein
MVSRTKLVFALLIFAAFTALSIWLTQQPFHPKPDSVEEWLGFSFGYVAAPLCAIGFIAVLVGLFKGHKPVRISAEGIQDLRTRRPMVPWKDVAELSLWGTRSAKYLVLHLNADAVTRLNDQQRQELFRNRMLRALTGSQ